MTRDKPDQSPLLAKSSGARDATDIAPLILLVRGERVILAQHLAELYGVSVKALNQAVKRNAGRFPRDFMFQLSGEEFETLKSQIVTSSWGGLRRALPYAFTEQGIAMLSSILRSQRAIQVNIAIMRTFVQLRRLMDANRELAWKIEQLEARYDEQFAAVFNAIQTLIAEHESERRRIGFTEP